MKEEEKVWSPYDLEPFWNARECVICELTAIDWDEVGEVIVCAFCQGVIEKEAWEAEEEAL